MKILEEIIITDSIEINASPEEVFVALIECLKKGESYRAWHPDHIDIQWIKGQPFEKGSILSAKEYLHGKPHKFNFRITEIKINKKIEYSPSFWLLRVCFPKNIFTFEPKGENCIFTASGYIRGGKLVKKFAKNKFIQGIEGIKKHITEEGENLKILVENKIYNNRSRERKSCTFTSLSSCSATKVFALPIKQKQSKSHGMDLIVGQHLRVKKICVLFQKYLGVICRPLNTKGVI